MGSELLDKDTPYVLSRMLNKFLTILMNLEIVPNSGHISIVHRHSGHKGALKLAQGHKRAQEFICGLVQSRPLSTLTIKAWRGPLRQNYTTNFGCSKKD
jgi:hypothetical protein